MKQRKSVFFIVLSVFLVLLCQQYGFAAATDQESLTITTKYPSQTGKFKELWLSPIDNFNFSY